MTTAHFYTKNGRFYGFEIAGHADYSVSGSDIVCAAISAMTSLAATCLENSGTKFSFKTDGDSPRAELKTEEFTPISENILESLYREVSALSKEYPAHIRAEKRER